MAQWEFWGYLLGMKILKTSVERVWLRRGDASDRGSKLSTAEKLARCVCPAVSYFRAALVMLACAALSVVAADVKDADGTSWDFENGLVGGWLSWGTNDVPKEKLGRIVAVVADRPHGCTHCLAIRDECDQASPYVIAKVKVDPARSYQIVGWLRSDDKLADGEHAGASAFAYAFPERTDGTGGHKVAGFLNLPTISVHPEWTRFEIKLPMLPAGATHLFLALKPVANREDKAATGTLYVDDLSLVEQ